MLRFFGILLFLIVVVFGLSFASLNAVSVPVNLYLVQGEYPLSLVMVLSFAAGVLIALAAASLALIRFRREVLRARRERKRMERERGGLRNVSA